MKKFALGFRFGLFFCFILRHFYVVAWGPTPSIAHLLFMLLKYQMFTLFFYIYFLPEKVEKELLEAESASIGDYIAESRNIANLHNQISSCDGILARMEGNHLGLNSHFTTQPGGLPNLLRHRLRTKAQPNFTYN